jgi:hypothetical protein
VKKEVSLIQLKHNPWLFFPMLRDNTMLYALWLVSHILFSNLVASVKRHLAHLFSSPLEKEK